MRFLLLILIFGQIAKAQDLGVSYLAISRFSASDCKLALKVFSGVKDPTLEFLWGTFGGSKSCVTRFIEAHPTGTVLIDPTNETCRRPPRYCTEGEINKHYRAGDYNAALARGNRKALSALLKRLRSVAAFTAKYPDYKFLITFGLEDNFNKKAFRKVEQIFLEVFDRAILIRNHYANNIFNGAYPHKLHGFDIPRNRKAYIFSNDGIDINTAAARRSINNAVVPSEMFSFIRSIRGNTDRIIMWWNTQGIVDGKFIQPRQRDIRIYHKDVTLINKFLRSLQNERENTFSN